MSAKLTSFVARWLDPRHLSQIEEVQGVEVVYRPDLAITPSGRDSLFYDADAIAAIEPRFTRTESEEAEWRTALRPAEVMFDIDPALGMPTDEVAPNLRWIQTVAAGVEAYLDFFPTLVSSGVTLLPARGVHSGPLADFAVMAVLQHAKRLSRLVDAKNAQEWDEFRTQSLAATQACIIGYGSIGRAVARRLRAFDVDVVGVRRDVVSEESVDPVVGIGELHAAVSQSNWVIVCLPGTRDTHHLVDDELINAMRPGTFLVNVGRGSVVDEAALVAALANGRLGGAALDVFEHEPLPQNSPLWQAPNLIISPHATAFNGSDTMQRLIDLFCENLRRELRGLPLVTDLGDA